MRAAGLFNNPAVKTLDAPGGFAPMRMTDAAVGGGLSFLTAELEKVDTKLREPLTSVTWQRDIVAKTGGGWVEFTSNYFVNYGTTGGNADGILGGQSNAIPAMQADIQKTPYKVFSWGHLFRVPFVDQEKLQNIGRNLEEILTKGIGLNYQKTIDQLVYKGFAAYGVTGLVNDANITAAAVANNAGATSKLWTAKTPDEILYDVNTIIVQAWAASEYDLSGIPNHIMIPPAQFAYIVSTKVSTAGNVSILNYLLENNVAKSQGVDLVIVPSRWCVGSGAGSTDRMVAYVNDEDKVNFDLTVPLTRIMTQPVVTEMAYVTAYAAQMGQVKFLYTQCARYGDGI